MKKYIWILKIIPINGPQSDSQNQVTIFKKSKFNLA